MRRTYRHDGRQREAPRRIATFHPATLRVAPHRYATRETLGTPGGSRAFSADGHPQAPVAPRRLCAARTFFVAQSGGMHHITNMPGVVYDGHRPTSATSLFHHRPTDPKSIEPTHCQVGLPLALQARQGLLIRAHRSYAHWKPRIEPSNQRERQAHAALFTFAEDQSEFSA
jgi:hypothetical protein